MTIHPTGRGRVDVLHQFLVDHPEATQGQVAAKLDELGLAGESAEQVAAIALLKDNRAAKASFAAVALALGVSPEALRATLARMSDLIGLAQEAPNSEGFAALMEAAPQEPEGSQAEPFWGKRQAEKREKASQRLTVSRAEKQSKTLPNRLSTAPMRPVKMALNGPESAVWADSERVRVLKGG